MNKVTILDSELLKAATELFKVLASTSPPPPEPEPAEYDSQVRATQPLQDVLALEEGYMACRAVFKLIRTRCESCSQLS